MGNLTHHQISERLEEIEQKIGERQDRFEDSANTFFKARHEYDLEHAKAVRRSKGSTATEKKADALVEIADRNPELYERYTTAEAEYEALKAILNSYDKRAMIGMALLKSSTREAGPQPTWTARAA